MALLLLNWNSAGNQSFLVLDLFPLLGILLLEIRASVLCMAFQAGFHTGFVRMRRTGDFQDVRYCHRGMNRTGHSAVLSAEDPWVKPPGCSKKDRMAREAIGVELPGSLHQCLIGIRMFRLLPHIIGITVAHFAGFQP